MFVLLVSCGSGDSSPSGGDGGGGDASTHGDGGGGCFPFCGGDGGQGDDAGGDDGGVSCDGLKALVESLETKARACNPQLDGQCTATTNDPCCPITVTISNTQAVADFDQAVATYRDHCSPPCASGDGGKICQPAPTFVCDPAGGDPTKGTCR